MDRRAFLKRSAAIAAAFPAVGAAARETPTVSPESAELSREQIQHARRLLLENQATPMNVIATGGIQGDRRSVKATFARRFNPIDCRYYPSGEALLRNPSGLRPF